MYTPSARFSCQFSLKRALLCALLPVVPLVAVGCGKHADTSIAATSAGGTAAAANADSSPAVNAGPPVTDTEAKQFADRLLAAIRGGNAAAVTGLLDMDAMADAATAGLGLSDKERSAFAGGLTSSLNESTGISANLIASVANGGNSNLLRFVEVDGRKRARLRMVHANNGGVGYTDFVLGHNASGQVVAQDIYVFAVGELATKLFRRLAVQALASQNNRSMLDRLKGVDGEFVAHLKDMETMMQDTQSGNGAGAVAIYNSLPDTLKADKSIKLMHINAAEKVNETEYQHAIGDFRAAFPNDAATDLLSIDYYLLKKQYAKCLTSIDGLDKSVGGDPYLDVLRAEVYILMRDRSKARAAIERGIKAVPNDKGAQQLQKSLSR